MKATRARIYKNEAGIWTVDVWMDRGLLTMMPSVFRLKDGTSVARSHHSSWEEAYEYLFGPKTDTVADMKH